MRLDIEDVASKNRVSFDFVEHNLTAEMFMPVVQRHLRDSVSLDAIVVQLGPVVLNHLFDLLMHSSQVMPALRQPLRLAVVLQFKDCWGNYPMHNTRVDVAPFVYLAL